jgi:hypothetical protein
MSQLAIQTPNQASPFFVIKVAQGPNKGDTYKITPPGAVIGSDREICQVVLDDARVSRQQCRIDFQPETITVEDLSGKNTTYVNQKPISGPHALAHGDVINVGETMIIFHTSNGPRAQNAPRPYAVAPAAAPGFQLPLSKNFLIFLGVIALAAFVLLSVPSKKKAAPPRVVSPEETNEAIAAVQKRQEELRKPYANLSEQDIYNKRSAQKHYIRGLRDLQNGRYTRAIEAFQTTLATDPTHAMARRNYKLAEKKRQDMVDYHMDLGSKYKEKSMYKYCIAEFEKVLQIINQPSHKKYILAKEQIIECRLSLQGSN